MIAERWMGEAPPQRYLRDLTVFLASHMSKCIDAKDTDGMNLMTDAVVPCIQRLAESGDQLAQKVLEHWDQAEGDAAAILEGIEALGKMYMLMVTGEKTTVRE
jgi:hypothetical protein